jgi:hypothetical protein
MGSWEWPGPVKEDTMQRKLGMITLALLILALAAPLATPAWGADDGVGRITAPLGPDMDPDGSPSQSTSSCAIGCGEVSPDVDPNRFLDESGAPTHAWSLLRSFVDQFLTP